MISTDDTEPEEEDDDGEDETQALIEGLRGIADSIKTPSVTVNSPVTVMKPKTVRVHGTYDGKPVDLTFTTEY